MLLQNKLGITDSSELESNEEKISKKKAISLFESDTLKRLDVGTFEALKSNHKYFFKIFMILQGKFVRLI